jgi:hypothetical protein
MLSAYAAVSSTHGQSSLHGHEPFGVPQRSNLPLCGTTMREAIPNSNRIGTQGCRPPFPS